MESQTGQDSRRRDIEKIRHLLESPLGTGGLAVVAVSSYSLFILVLFRFFRGFTVSSYGRIWHFFVSYADFGLARRALIGSMVRLSGLDSLVGEYQLAYSVHAAMVGLLVWIMCLLAASGKYSLRLVDALILFLSPAFIVYQGYNTGSLDLYLLLLSVAAIFAPFCGAIASLVVLVFLGCLVHEAFMFMAPFLVGMRLVCLPGICRRRSVLLLCLPVVSMAFLAVYMQFVGSDPPDYVDYLHVISSRIPDSARASYPYWDGYFELFSSLSANTVNRFSQLGDLLLSLHLAAVPLAYLIACCFCFFGLASRRLGRLNAGILSVYASMPVFILVGDFYRWVSLGCVLALLGCLKLWRESSERQPFWLSCFLAGSVLLVSFGHVVTRPFPLWQSVLGMS